MGAGRGLQALGYCPSLGYNTVLAIDEIDEEK
jgi:hypothetical protein